ncbi:hypothetical protein ACIQF6_20780 [Kitasatospora sp. NPDC092948]|uniref:hypothetical protein n=1 Tax=Kitasatospora sp. NPDC092948 TaxID=3364088 RepID=UPI003814AF3A
MPERAWGFNSPLAHSERPVDLRIDRPFLVLRRDFDACLWPGTDETAFVDAGPRAEVAGGQFAGVNAGSGAPAFTAPALLADLAPVPALWVPRRGILGSTGGRGTADQLRERGALGLRAKAAVEAGHASALTGFRAAAVEFDGGCPVVAAKEGHRSEAR